MFCLGPKTEVNFGIFGIRLYSIVNLLRCEIS